MTDRKHFSRASALSLDAEDPFQDRRLLFDLPEDLVYLDGNSLGACPKSVQVRLEKVTGSDWPKDLITGWWKGWMDLPTRIGARIAPLIGADPASVLACDSTSINLYKLAAAALKAQTKRSIILTDSKNFPTDLYILKGLVEQLGPPFELRDVSKDRILDALDDRVALLCLSHVDYRSAELWDMGEITEKAHAVGALALWDLSHSAGAISVDLHETQADLAIGCGYKFLNGGPGAPAFLYVAPHLQNKLHTPLTGWMGHSSPFDFSAKYAPAEGIKRFACGTPPVLGLSALDAALDVFDDVPLDALFKKGADLCDLFTRLCADLPGIAVVSPSDPKLRGAHVALAHEDAAAIMQRLEDRGIIGDFRPPDVMRFGFAPLYCRYVDAYDAAIALAEEVSRTRPALAD